MRSTWTVVHIVRSYNFVLNSKVIESNHIIHRFTLESIQVLNCKNIVLVPLQLEAWSVNHNSFYMWLVQQIVYLLLVNLKVAAVNSKLLFLQVALLLYQVEEKTDRTRYYTFVISLLENSLRWFWVMDLFVFVTLHGVGLSWTCLAVSKNSRMIALSISVKTF